MAGDGGNERLELRTVGGGSVRYPGRVSGDGTTLHNIDSAFVFSEPGAEVIDMPEDNYS